jgi:hypothetical protein
LIIETLHDEEEYRRIHGLLFNQPLEKVPPVVQVGRNDTGAIVAFVSGFWIESNHFYIQFSGVLPEYQKAGYLRYLGCVLENNITYDLAIENVNTVAIKIALSVGFVPIGFIKRGNKSFVQLERKQHG